MSASYEEPESPKKMLETDKMDLEQYVNVILNDMSQNRTILMKKEKYSV